MSQTLSAGIEPKTRSFLESLNSQGGPAIYELSVADARKVFAGLQSSFPVTAPPTDVEDRTISTDTAGELRLRIIRPKGASGKLPVVMYFRGGGWVLGTLESHDRLVKELAHGTGAAIVFLDYTPAPEAQYPVAIEQAYAATKWIAANGDSIGLDGSRLAVAGDSVGGNMSIAVTMLAKERGGPKIAFQSLFYPVTDANFDTGSYKEFAEGHFLTLGAMKWFWNHYAPDEAVRAKPTASPLRAPIDALKGLPPALVMTGEFDVLRDEGEAYAHRLIEAGVTVTAVRYHGTIHDFALLNVITETPAARGAIAQAIGALRQALAG